MEHNIKQKSISHDRSRETTDRRQMFHLLVPLVTAFSCFLSKHPAFSCCTRPANYVGGPANLHRSLHTFHLVSLPQRLSLPERVLPKRKADHSIPSLHLHLHRGLHLSEAKKALYDPAGSLSTPTHSTFPPLSHLPSQQPGMLSYCGPVNALCCFSFSAQPRRSSIS